MVDLSGKVRLNRSVNELLGPGKTMAPPVPLTIRRWVLDFLLFVIWFGAFYLLGDRLDISRDTMSLLTFPVIMLPASVPYLTMRRYALVRTIDELVLFECQGLSGKATRAVESVDEADVHLIPGGTFRPGLEIRGTRYLVDRRLLKQIGISE